MYKELSNEFINKLKEDNKALTYPYAHVLQNLEVGTYDYGDYHALIHFDESWTVYPIKLLLMIG